MREGTACLYVYVAKKFYRCGLLHFATGFPTFATGFPTFATGFPTFATCLKKKKRSRKIGQLQEIFEVIFMENRLPFSSRGSICISIPCVRIVGASLRSCPLSTFALVGHVFD
jgi:hypothetical protein